jgi:hypothetical protein
MSAADQAKAIVLDFERELAQTGAFGGRPESMRSYLALKPLEDAVRLEVAVAVVMREIELRAIGSKGHD